MARTLRVLLLVESSRGSGRSLLRGIAHYANHHGPWSFYWEPGGLEKVWPKLKTLDPDGIILRDVDKLEEVLAFGIPAVVIGHGRPEVPGLVNIVTDSEAVGRMAAEHLLSCGFKHFAYCGSSERGAAEAPWSASRRRSFSARVERAGFTVANFSLAASAHGSSWRRERAAMARWLRALTKPIGLMACNDDRAGQLVEACKMGDISVPNDAGIIGVDDDDVVCGLSNPPLSSIALTFERSGYEGAAALDCLMRGIGSVSQRILVRATHVVARRSTDVVAVEDANLAKAMRFIRAHSPRENPSVEEVARQSGVSRRLLEQRFRGEFGCSILHEIRRVRTDKIAQLLMETQLPVREIADALGFADAQHFARYFRSARKISPLAYRRTLGGHHAPEPPAQIGDSFAQSGVVSPMPEP